MQTDSSGHGSCPKCQKAVDGLPNFCPSCGEDLRGLTPLSDTLSGTAEGRLIEGRYRLREKLGEGGMGSVYKVEHVRMGKICALKLLRPEVATDKKLKTRFHQEARVVSKLSSQNTIQVFDFGELEDGSLYIAMEYVSGRDLSWMLRAQGTFSEEKVMAIGIQVLSSLAEAHDNGIIHRDIKPANVMVVKRRERDDLVKVLDFGIAKLHESEDRKHITGAADFIGTPSYMSPEQAKGEALDARSDLYSVGAMLFELACGKPPFEAATPMAIVTKHLSEQPPRFQELAPDKVISPAFEQIIRKALSKDRKDRFSSADEMRAALEKLHRALAQLPNDFTPLPDQDTAEMARREDFDRFERGLRWRRTLLPLLTVALLSAGGFYGWRWFNASPVINGFPTAEQEPDNIPQQATPIRLGDAITGTIGPGPDATTSDIDVFKLELAQTTPLTVSVTGVDGLNLVVDAHWLKAGAGSSDKPERVLLLDDASESKGERIDGLVVEPGTLFVRVQEHPHVLEKNPLRAPREKSMVPYTLRITRLDVANGVAEREPNDTVKAAQRIADPKQPIVAFGGAYVPMTSDTRTQSWASQDFFAVAEDWAPSVSAIVVPPAGGQLFAIDAASGEVPGEKEAKNSDVKKLIKEGNALCPAPCADKPVVVPLKALKGDGYVLHVEPAAGAAEPGTSYLVAFISGGERGLDSAMSLAKTLDEDRRTAAAAEVLELAIAQFPESKQAAEARELAEKWKPLAKDQP
ncbi:MAG: serine/threonine protein kinase [Myxococcaceae bacterium]